jgi:hypothetical protein
LLSTWLARLFKPEPPEVFVGFAAVLFADLFEVFEVLFEVLAVLGAGAADFWVPVAAEDLVCDFTVSALAAFFVLEVTDAVVVVVGSGLATTSSTTPETLTRLMSLITALVLGGRGAMLKAVTGALTVTCSTASASTPTERRTTLDEVAERDCVDTATRAGRVGTTAVGGCVAVGSLERTSEVAAEVAEAMLDWLDWLDWLDVLVVLAAFDVPDVFELATRDGFGVFADWFARAVVDAIVSDPMVLTVVVLRRGFEVLVIVGLVMTGGVEAMTNEVRSGPAWVVDVADRRRRT